MTASNPKQRLLRRSEEAARRHGQARSEDEPCSRPPSPGDLFQFPETPELQWAVLEHGANGKLRVVAADVHPAIGSADVAAPPESACGALSLRCRLAVWLEADQFDLENRTGSLEPTVLDRARQKRAALDAGRPVGSPAEQETDLELEYQELLQELESAGAILRERDAPAPTPRNNVAPARRPAPRWGATSNPYALAAVVLLAVSLALVAGMIGQLRKVATLERRISEAGPEKPAVQLPFAWLSPQEEIRGPGKTVTVGREASYIILALEVIAAEPYPSYRLDILEKDAGSPIFSEVVEQTGLTEVSVLLPRRVLGTGEYQLRLYGLGSGKAELVGNYALSLELD